MCDFVPAISGSSWNISGTVNGVPGGGVTMTLSGAASATATSDSSGNYSFGGLANGAYTITPTHSGYTFTPASQNVTINGASISGINFNSSGNQSVIGQWSSVMSWPIVSLNAVLMKTGKVLVYDRPSAGPTAQVWDPVANTFTNVPNNTTDLFCSGHSEMSDGRVLVIGGHGASDAGTADVNIFDPTSQTWTLAPRMAYERWYG